MCLLVLRVPIAQRAQTRAGDSLVWVTTMADDACREFRLFADYFKRTLMLKMFARSVDSHCEETLPGSLIRINTEYTAKFLSGIVIAVYIIVNTPHVLSGDLSLGIFLATISIFSTYLYDAIAELNLRLMIIVESLTALEEITTLMNMPLGLERNSVISKERRARTRIKHAKNMRLLDGEFSSSCTIAENLEDLEDGQEPEELAIEFCDVSFVYPDGMLVFDEINFTFPQGQMVAIMGKNESGKSTFVELLSNILLPTKGSIFVPAYARVLHVSREPLFLRGTLLHNLAMGLPRNTPVDVTHICGILDKLGMQQFILPVEKTFRSITGEKNSIVYNASREVQIKQVVIDKVFWDSVGTEENNSWAETLSRTCKTKLHLARALIANPDVMILHHTTHDFNHDVADKILDVLHEHVVQRGLCLEGDAARRPRTLFYTTEHHHDALRADVIVQTNLEEKSLIQVNREELHTEGVSKMERSFRRHAPKQNTIPASEASAETQSLAAQLFVSPR